MSEVVRFSISLEADLLERFNEYCRKRQIATRSEAIRQLLHDSLTQHAWESDTEDAAATVTLVYDHHRTHLSDRLLEVQHRRAGLVVSTMHIHLDHDNCLEVIVLRGPAAELRELAVELSGLKGIRKGQFVLATTKESR